jgi:cytosine/adenosine deaminase-related metal-dependent hydrolase
VLPISSPPIDNGSVLVIGHRVARVEKGPGLSSQSDAEVMDLGDSILMPGLINAHCHLDYTDMAGMIPPRKGFTEWINFMLAAKAEWNYSEFAASWLHGAAMLLRSGTTTVADFEAVPELLPHVWSATPLRLISLIEMTGVRHRRDPAGVLNEALALIQRLPGGRCQAGLAPHALYSIPRELPRMAAAMARRRGWLFAIHASESREEFDMFKHARGEMYRWLERNERAMNDCAVGSPIRLLDSQDALGRSTLAVHVNYLARGDASLLASRGATVVHCPRSHAYFGHQRFPFEQLTRAGVNICLGTDSLATVRCNRSHRPELDLFQEMRAFAATRPAVSAARVVRMATVSGARALGLEGRAGEIRAGAFADLIALPFSGTTADAYEAVVAHHGRVKASLIEGQWAIVPDNAKPLPSAE